jgi:hypoxanthine phosphoribosyltransferase
VAPEPSTGGTGGDAGRVLLTSAELSARIGELGEAIGRDYRGRVPLLVAVLKGAFVFLADLVRAIPIDHEIDFMAVASYGASTRSSGIVRIVKDLDIDLEDRHVLIIEDIVDSGLTLAYLRRMLASRNPASLEVCALLARETISPADRASLRYVGFTVPPEFVVGYGLDLAERYRNLPDVHVWDGPGEAAGPGPAGTAG